MRTNAQRGRSGRRQRHRSAGFHIHAIRFRMHGRFLRGDVQQNRLARRRRHAQILCDATCALLYHHRSAYARVHTVHKADACLGERHPHQRSGLQCRIHLLFCDLSRNGSAAVLQLCHQHIEKHRRLVYAARLPFHIHDHEHLA